MSEIPAGAMRFNSDSQKLEYWNGSAWFQVHTATPDLASAGDSTPGPRGVMGGSVPQADHIDYINISSTGDAINFGDLTGNECCPAHGVSSSTRGTFPGGSQFPARQTGIDRITFASTGDAVEYGNLSVGRAESAGISNGTRGIVAGGSTTPGDSNEIDYWTISSGGTAVDWGVNLSDARERMGGAVNSTTRGLVYGGQSPAVNTIEYITMATIGNVTDFGDLPIAGQNVVGGGNVIRGIFSTSESNPYNNATSYVTIATTGNAADFGDLTVARALSAGVSSPTRLVICGGLTPATSDVMDYANILTQGNFVDFGDLSVSRYGLAGVSNAHGGL
jgi:hypothetical protein